MHNVGLKPNSRVFKLPSFQYSKTTFSPTSPAYLEISQCST